MGENGKNELLLLKLDLSTVPEEVKICPIGHVESTKGSFTVDEDSLHSMKAAITSRGLQIVIDYEHQTLQDVQAPAAGWIRNADSLQIKDGAIVAKVEWTPRAKEYLANKEYKYLSPVVLLDDKKHVIGLHSVALTNTPAIDGMFAIVNKSGIEIPKEEKKEMDLNVLIKLLGLPETATPEDVQSAIEKLVEIEKECKEKKECEVVANKTILGLLGLKDDAKTEDVSASILALKQMPDQVRSELKALKERMAKEDANKLVCKALETGKISAAQKEWAMEYALKDSKGFESFMEKAPVVVPLKSLNYANITSSDMQTEEELMVCKQLGVTKEDLEKYGKEVK